MNAILGFGQLLERDASLGETQLDFIKEMMKAGRHLLDLINEVLDLSKIESGKLALSTEAVSCAALIEEGLGLIAPLAEKRGIRIERDISSKITVMADRMRLKQALVNLLSNAVKYNSEKGYIKVVLSRKEGRARIEVIDSGAGIPKARIPELFLPFNRLGRDLGEIEGTGIGLVISKRLVELMNGSIGAESEEGRGSLFWIELPRAEIDLEGEEESTRGAIDRGAAPRGLGSTVLYIEDNAANLRLVGQILATRRDIKLLTASNASLGLELAETQRPDLVLLDLNLPELDGYGVLSLLRAKEWGRSLPVVAVTALAMPHDIDRARSAGFAEYLTKPIEVERFLRVVDECLARGGA